VIDPARAFRPGPSGGAGDRRELRDRARHGPRALHDRLDVCIAARSPEKNAAALAELAQFGTRVDALTCDVTAEDQIAGAMARTIDGFDRVDT
jgi:hypothetical protein